MPPRKHLGTVDRPLPSDLCAEKSLSSLGAT